MTIKIDDDGDLMIDIKSKDDKHRGPGFQITECWMFVALDESGGEGLLGETMEFGGRWTFMPFVATDEHRRDFFYERAIRLARKGRKTVKMIKLTMREEAGMVWSPQTGAVSRTQVT